MVGFHPTSAANGVCLRPELPGRRGDDWVRAEGAVWDVFESCRRGEIAGEGVDVVWD